MPDETTPIAAPESVATTAPMEVAPPPGEVRTAEADAKPVGVPEKYELKAPEGMTFHPESVAKFEALARELGYDNDQAQGIVDVINGEVQATQTRQMEAWQQQQETWVNELKADKEIGGANFDRTIGRAQAFAKVLDPSGKFGELIDALGIGNHPVLVKGFEKLGALLEEDGPIDSGSPSLKALGAKSMFPNSPELK